MPGRNNASNKYGYSPFIVSPTLGDGGNYSTIQSAIDDCFAAGGGTVLVKTGTYLENLTMRPTVDLLGNEDDGRLPSTLGHVVIQGNHTITGSGGFDIIIVQCINFVCLAGDILTVNSAATGAVIFAAKFCGFEANTDPASRCIVLNSQATAATQFSTDNCNLSAFSHVFEGVGAGTQNVSLNLGSCNSGSGNAFLISSGSGTITGTNTQISANVNIANFVAGSGTASFRFTDLTSGQESVLFGAGGGQVDFFHDTISSGAASTFFVDGPTGQVNLANLNLNASAIDIGPTLTQVQFDWKPYAQPGAPPGLPAFVRRGTAAFDQSQFNVSDGFVQLASPFTPFAWIDQPVSVGVNVNQGNFVTGAGVTLTMPGAPVQGDVCKFKATSISTFVIQANGAQTLQVANQTSIAAGTATSTQIGDSIEFTFFAAGNVWIANSIIGIWNVV